MRRRSASAASRDARPGRVDLDQPPPQLHPQAGHLDRQPAGGEHRWQQGTAASLRGDRDLAEAHPAAPDRDAFTIRVGIRDMLAAFVDVRLVGPQDEPQLEAGVAHGRSKGVHDLLRLGTVVLRRSSTNLVTTSSAS